MSTSKGLRIISVAKSLDAFQRDGKISRFFGATLIAGHGGVLLSSLRLQSRISWDKFVVLASEARIERQQLKPVILPWLTRGGFVELGTGDKPLVNCNVIDYDAILRATAELFDSQDPTEEEEYVLTLLNCAIRIPTLASDALNQLGSNSESPALTALDLAKGYKIVRVLDGHGIDEPLIYSPLIWGDNITKAGQALTHMDANKRSLVLELVDRVRRYQGLPQQAAVTWSTQQGEPDLVRLATGLGLLDRTEIHTKEGNRQPFLTTPHLYGELAAAHGRDVCDRVRLFLDSIRHGQHFGQWHTGRIRDPVVLLEKLLNNGEIGPCTAIGNDYVLVEKAGVVTVKPSRYKAGQFVMELVQSDTVRLIRDILQQPHGLSGVAGVPGVGAMGQDRFVSSEQSRAKAGELPEQMREAEAEMLKSLREIV
ncbi:MAG TPA: hypothetical protein VJ783_00565 [Pirellulales bacterium]|nr:hypothetical protein [Pirellulales bacterium]